MRSSSVRAVALCAGLLAACARTPRPAGEPPAPATPSPPAAEPRNGLEVIGWMRYAHPSRELRTLAFTMTRTRVADSSTSESLAYARLPGAMRTDAVSGDATSLVRDRYRASVFRRGRRVSTLRGVDLRTLLAFDVFAEGIDTTIMWLDSARVRFGLARQDDWEGRRVWVVGANAGDDTSTQFWVDARRWRVVRVIQPEPENPRLVSDTRYLDFDDLLDTPVPTRVEVWRNGRLVEQHALKNFVANPELPSRAFDLSRLHRISAAARSAP